jgi:hypothetical protein
VSRGKRLLEEYYIKIWNAAYTNNEKASQLNHSLDTPQNDPNPLAKPHPYAVPNKPWMLSLIPL